MSDNATVIIALVSLGFNFLMLLIQARIKGDLSELKAHMYEHFATKRDMHTMFRRSSDPHS